MDDLMNVNGVVISQATAAAQGNATGSGNDISSQIKVVMKQIADLTQRIKDEGPGMSKEELKAIQMQMQMLQQRLADLIAKQAEEHKQKHKEKQSNDNNSAEKLQALTSINVYA